jgi:hypothetical protein
MTTRTCSITVTAAITALIAFAPQIVAKTAGSVTVAQEARETLKELKGIAAKAAGQAEYLDHLSQFNAGDSSSHMIPLGELREEVNTMGKEIAGLEAMRDSLEPWEQEAVDKVLPLLKEAAANTQSAIHYYNENRRHLWSPDYQAYTGKVEQDSNQIARTLENYLKYEEVREAEIQLQSTIGAGSN